MTFWLEHAMFIVYSASFLGCLGMVAWCVFGNRPDGKDNR